MLLWVAEINRYFKLGESLRVTIRRPWHDLLAFRAAMAAEYALVEKLRGQESA